MRVTRSLRLCVPALLLTLGASGPQQPSFPYRARCAADRSLHRPPRFGCINAANLAPMLADRADLAHGRAPTPTMGALDAAAIERLRNDTVKPLLGTGATDSFKAPVAKP